MPASASSATASSLQANLEPLGRELGVAITVGHATYSDENATFKVEVAAIRGGQTMTRAGSAFKQLAHLYGLRPEDFGREFTSPSGRRFRITGLNTRARTTPVLATALDDGRPYKFRAELVAKALAAEPVIKGAIGSILRDGPIRRLLR